MRRVSSFLPMKPYERGTRPGHVSRVLPQYFQSVLTFVKNFCAVSRVRLQMLWFLSPFLRRDIFAASSTMADPVQALEYICVVLFNYGMEMCFPLDGQK